MGIEHCMDGLWVHIHSKWTRSEPADSHLLNPKKPPSAQYIYPKACKWEPSAKPSEAARVSATAEMVSSLYTPLLSLYHRKISVVSLPLYLSKTLDWFVWWKQGKGTGSFGKRRNKTHTLCIRCGRRSFHLQKSRCAACGYPAARIRKCKPSDLSLLSLSQIWFSFLFLLRFDSGFR